MRAAVLGMLTGREESRTTKISFPRDYVPFRTLTLHLSSSTVDGIEGNCACPGMCNAQRW